MLSDNGTPHDKSDDVWTSYTVEDGLPDRVVLAVTVDELGQKWLGTSNGLGVLSDNGTPHDKGDDTWTTFTEADGLVHKSVYAIAVDRAGNEWFGTYGGGVSVLDDNGTPHNKSDDTWTTFYVGDCNQGLAIDAAGRKWIATGWSGVRMLDDAGTPHDQGDDVWRMYTRAEGLVEDRAQCIAVSSGGTVWVGTDGGVSRMAGGQHRLYVPLILVIMRYYIES